MHVLPSKDELPISPYPSSSDENGMYPKLKSFVDNRTSFLLPRLSKLGFLSDILLAVEMESVPEAFGTFLLSEISDMRNDVAFNCSALAIDGYRIIRARRKGSEASIDSSDNDAYSIALRSGLTFPRLWFHHPHPPSPIGHVCRIHVCD